MEKKIEYREIEKAFTDAVSGMIADGFRFCTRTMGGGHGEIAFVDLLRGNSFVRVEMSRKCGYGDPDKILLAVGRMDASKRGALSDGETGHVCVFCSALEWEVARSFAVSGDGFFVEVLENGKSPAAR